MSGYSISDDEHLREACCIGHFDLICKLLQAGVNVNGQNKINGMTPLHWACKREHKSIVSLLLAHNAYANIKRHDGLLPYHMTTNPDILTLLPVPIMEDNDDNMSLHDPSIHTGDFVPHYLKDPPFPYGSSYLSEDLTTWSEMNTATVPAKSYTETKRIEDSKMETDSLLLRVRIANDEDPDFNEITLPMQNLNINSLKECVSTELNISTSDIKKIRKLPNIVVSKDDDVRRLKANQELEIVRN